MSRCYTLAVFFDTAQLFDRSTAVLHKKTASSPHRLRWLAHPRLLHQPKTVCAITVDADTYEHKRSSNDRGRTRGAGSKPQATDVVYAQHALFCCHFNAEYLSGTWVEVTFGDLLEYFYRVMVFSFLKVCHAMEVCHCIKSWFKRNEIIIFTLIVTNVLTSILFWYWNMYPQVYSAIKDQFLQGFYFYYLFTTRNLTIFFLLSFFVWYGKAISVG